MWRYFRACLSNLPAHPLEWKPSRMLTTTLLPYMCRLSHLYTFMRPMRNISIGQHLSKNAALVGKWSNHEKQLFSKHLPPVTLVSYSGKHHLSKPQTYQVTCTRIGRFPYTAISAEEAQCNRPVVVLIGWLNAKEKHLRKYQEIYWQRGFDVLMMPVSALHIVRPRHGIRYTKELLSVLQGCRQLEGRHIVVHGFSIAAFIYTQMLLLLKKQQNGCKDFEQDLGGRLVGVILDSPAYVDNMCHGIADSVTSSAALRSLITHLLLSYLAAFPRSVTFHYRQSHDIYHDNNIPTLILQSDADVISSAAISSQYVDMWNRKGLPAFTHNFVDSEHVTHFRKYPEEYIAVLDSFLDILRLTSVHHESVGKDACIEICH